MTNRQSGFTLIEIMVASAVAMLLLAGAFEMHAAFNRQSLRQQEVADMQQALRVATQVISRAVRDAGSGLYGGTAQMFDSLVAPQPCPVPTGNAPAPNPLVANQSCLYAVQYSNHMPYFQGLKPPASYDITTNDNDTDEDWLRVISFDGTKVTRINPLGGSGNNPAGNVIAVTDTRYFPPPGGFFFVGNSYPAYQDATGKPTLGWRTGCVRQVTAANPVSNAAGAVPTPGTITFSPNGYNPAYAGDLCFQSVDPTNLNKTTYVYPVDTSVVFQILPLNGIPTLVAAYSKPGSLPVWAPELPVNASTFKTIAENIEHMQIALILNDGTICGSLTNSVDAPGNALGQCSFQNVRAVRLTLVARSSSKWYGWLSQGNDPTKYWEDYQQQAVATPDGYLRRTLTTEITIRNNPWGVQ